LTRLTPADPGVHATLGFALLLPNRRDFDRAWAEFREAARLKPDLALTWVGIGSVYMVKGEVDSAIKEFSYALTLDPRLAFAHFQLGLAHLKKGNRRVALNQLHLACELEPSSSLFRTEYERLLRQQN